jgi:hypothetical protein
VKGNRSDLVRQESNLFQLPEMCKSRANSLKETQFSTAFQAFSKKRDYGLPYPQKPRLPPLTPPLRLLRVSNREYVIGQRASLLKPVNGAAAFSIAVERGPIRSE